MYVCPTMPPAPCPPECPPPKPRDAPTKYFREIGTAMIGNQLIIRVERQKGKSKKLKDWDPPCDCDVEIVRPTSKEGPKILKGADNNRILFRVERQDISKDEDQDTAQTISYEVGECKGGVRTNDQCRTFTIYPVFKGAGVQKIHTDRVTEGNENVFMLRMKKKSDSSAEQPRKNVELEVRTPKPPPLPPEKLEKPLIVDEDCVKLVTKEEIPQIETPKQEVKKKKKKKKK